MRGGWTRLIQYLWFAIKDWVGWLYFIPAAVVGIAQLVQAILPEGWLMDILRAFTTPWPLFYWIIIGLLGLVIVFGRAAWRLGGFSMEIALTLRSRVLPNDNERYVGLHIRNDSPKVISALSLVLTDLREVTNNKWAPPANLIVRNDPFRWSAKDENGIIGKRSIEPGHEVIADLLWLSKESWEELVVLLQSSDLISCPSGNRYELGAMIECVYGGKPYRLPVFVWFTFHGGLSLTNLRFEHLESHDWRTPETSMRVDYA